MVKNKWHDVSGERNAITAHWRKRNRKVLIRCEFSFSIKSRWMSTTVAVCLCTKRVLCDRQCACEFPNWIINASFPFQFPYIISFTTRFVTRKCGKAHRRMLLLAHNIPNTRHHHNFTYEWYEFNRITIFYCVWWVLAVEATTQIGRI